MMRTHIVQLGLLVAISLAACAPVREPASGPGVAAAQRACAGLPDGQREECIVDQAAQTLHPEICRLLNIYIDDWCLQAVYEAADDPAICDRLYLEGIRPTCRDYYADPHHVPRVLTPTPMPAGVDLGTVAYVQDGDIWLKRLPNGAPQRITSDGVNREPLWSPSGRWLAFRKLDSQLWLYSTETGPAHAVDQGAPVNYFRWSPAADTMAYVVGSGVLHLRTLAAGSTEGTALTIPSPTSGPGSFAWSPDGRELATIWTGSDVNGEYRQEIRLQPAAGGDQTPLYVGGNPAVEPALGLAGWLPSGQALLIWQGARLIDSTLPDAVDLVTLPAGRGRPFTGELPLYARDASWWLMGDLAPAPAGSAWADKDVVATTVGDGPPWTNKRSALADEPVTPGDQVAIQPAWSPGGETLAYSGMPDPGDVMLDRAGDAVSGRRIWIADTAGAPAWRQLTDDPSFRDEHPQWSADGAYLLFARLDVADSASLWLIPAHGGQPALMVEEMDLGGPTDDFKVQIDWGQSYDWLRGR